MKSNKFKTLSTVILLLLSLIFISCNNESIETISSIPEETYDPIEINIVAAGDLVMHMPVVNSAYDSKNNTYNFDDIFKNVKEYISDADLAICNNETSYLGPKSTFSGYPTFNSPEEILDSVKNTGFDILTSAHNHTLDKGIDGFNGTITEITERNIGLLGIRNNIEEKNYIVKDVNGIKIGITNYTYSTYDNYGNNTLNGIPIPKELESKINTFAEKTLDKDLENMKTTYDNMINDGAEFTIFYIHWGNEYQQSPSKYQENIAQKLNSYGIDAIIGSHPHVVQPIRKIINETNSKETLVCYSLGNFLSNQSRETIGNARSEDGLMVKLTIYKDEFNKVSLKSYESEPTWVYRSYNKNGKSKYNIMLLKDIISDDESLEAFSPSTIDRMKSSYNETEKVINN